MIKKLAPAIATQVLNNSGGSPYSVVQRQRFALCNAKIKVFLMKRDFLKPGLERPVDHPLAVNFRMREEANRPLTRARVPDRHALLKQNTKASKPLQYSAQQ